MGLFHHDALLHLPLLPGLLPRFMLLVELVAWCAGEDVEEGGLEGG
jgi:hypothetical protein